MALDWKKEVSFAGLSRKSPKSETGYPTKTHMNLAVREKSKTNSRKAIPLAIVLVVAVALFAKFAVLDLYAHVGEEESKLRAAQSTLSQLQQKLADYDKVLEEYESYDSAHLSPDVDIVSALDAFELIDDVVAPNAQVSSINLAGNTLTLTVSNITLGSTGSLVSLLYEQPQVASVAVTTSSTQQTSSEDVVTVMTVTLQRPEAEE